MKPWVTVETVAAPDGKPIELRRRGHEFLIRADGYDLMSSEDVGSSKALAELGIAAVGRPARRVLVGGLGMGFTLRAALDNVDAQATVEVAELIDAVARWNAEVLAPVAGSPLADPRACVHVGDVRERIADRSAKWDAILLDVDNGPDALAHDGNDAIYSRTGLHTAYGSLAPDGVLAVWSFSDDREFTRRCERVGFRTRVERVSASRNGRGRYHYIWIAAKSGAPSGKR